MSVVTLGDLRVGAERSLRGTEAHRIIGELLGLIPAVAPPEAPTNQHGEVRAHPTRTGQIIGSNDLCIGAHARSVGATPLTSNVRELMRIPS